MSDDRRDYVRQSDFNNLKDRFEQDHARLRALEAGDGIVREKFHHLGDDVTAIHTLLERLDDTMDRQNEILSGLKTTIVATQGETKSLTADVRKLWLIFGALGTATLSAIGAVAFALFKLILTK